MSGPHPSWSDPELADHLEGLLDPAVADALAAELERDAALRARSEDLASVLPEPLRLPSLDPPGELEPRVTERLVELPRDAELADALEGIGDEALLARDPERAAALELAGSLPPLSPPPGLFGRALAQLEAEGLVRPGEACPQASDEELADLLEGNLEPAEA
ncbi:MAG TPA: hypothetical protein DEA08_36830, partial [Planctomycetes bacterium]|nr:hypothetical protein [Planctomycetota bacterium]